MIILMNLTDRLVVDLELKMDDTEKGVFTGYGSTFGNVDNGKDRCVKGCFGKSLKEMKSQNQMPQMLWMHDPKLPIGDWEEVEEDDKGLRVKGRLWVGVGIPEAERAYKMLTGSGPKGLSIGFKTVQATHDKSGVRSLLEVNVPEISVVGRGMNPKATVENVKNDNEVQKLQSVASQIKSEVMQHKMMKTLQELKYSPDQPRDENGRWTDGGGSNGGSVDRTELRDGMRVVHNGRQAYVLGNPDPDPTTAVQIVYRDNPDEDAFVMADKLKPVSNADQSQQSMIQAHPKKPSNSDDDGMLQQYKPVAANAGPDRSEKIPPRESAGRRVAMQIDSELTSVTGGGFYIKDAETLAKVKELRARAQMNFEHAKKVAEKHRMNVGSSERYAANESERNALQVLSNIDRLLAKHK